MKPFIPFLLAFAFTVSGFAANNPAPSPYKLLATSLTSTMEKELNQAAGAGYRLESTMGGEIKDGEIITVMKKVTDGARYHYKLLATSRTGTMQKELQDAADEGYDYAGYTGRGEVIVILEKDLSKPTRKHYDYKLLATSRTATMQRELDEAATQGYEFVAVIKRGEVIAFLRRPA